MHDNNTGECWHGNGQTCWPWAMMKTNDEVVILVTMVAMPHMLTTMTTTTTAMTTATTTATTTTTQTKVDAQWNTTTTTMMHTMAGN